MPTRTLASVQQRIVQPKKSSSPSYCKLGRHKNPPGVKACLICDSPMLVGDPRKSHRRLAPTSSTESSPDPSPPGSSDWGDDSPTGAGETGEAGATGMTGVTGAPGAPGATAQEGWTNRFQEQEPGLFDEIALRPRNKSKLRVRPEGSSPAKQHLKQPSQQMDPSPQMDPNRHRRQQSFKTVHPVSVHNFPKELENLY